MRRPASSAASNPFNASNWSTWVCLCATTPRHRRFVGRGSRRLPLGRAWWPGGPCGALVEADLSLPGHPEVFVIGDLASLKHADGKQIPPEWLQVAMQQGRWVARQIAADLAGQRSHSFSIISDRGSLATIGRACGGGPIWQDPHLGIPCVVVLALRSHFLPDWLSQPHHRDDRMGVELFHLRPLGEVDYG